MRNQERASRHAKETSETLKIYYKIKIFIKTLFYRMIPLWLIVYSNPARFIDKPKVLVMLECPYSHHNDY